MEPTPEAKEKAAVRLSEAFTEFGEALAECAELGVDIQAELEKQGLDVPPALGLMLSGALGG